MQDVVHDLLASVGEVERPAAWVVLLDSLGDEGSTIGGRRRIRVPTGQNRHVPTRRLLGSADPLGQLVHRQPGFDPDREKSDEFGQAQIVLDLFQRRAERRQAGVVGTQRVIYIIGFILDYEYEPDSR